MKKTTLLAAICAIATLSSALSYGAEARKGYVGPAFGLGVPTGMSAMNPGFSVGGSFGYRFIPQVAGDLTLMYTKFGTDYSSLSADVTQLLFGVNYFVPSLQGLRVGAHLGPVFESVLGFSETEFGFGAKAGYDYMITPELSIGAEIAWTLIPGDPKTYNIFNFTIPLRLHF